MPETSIAIDMRCVRPGATGVGRSVAQLAAHMAAAAPQRRFCLLALRGADLGALAKLANVEMVRVPFDMTQHPGNEWWLNARLRPLLGALGADLYHGPAFHAPWRDPGVPVVVTVHDLTVFESRTYYSARFRYYMQWMIRLAVRRASRVVAVSEAVRQALLKRLGLAPARVAVVPHGAPPGLEPPAPAERVRAFREQLGLPERYILSIGALEPRKNAIGLARAVARIPQSERPLLVWAGAEGRRSRAIHESMLRLLGPDGLRWLSRIDDADLALLRCGAAALAGPSFSEGFGLPILEAMAGGLPVVCSDIPAHREVAGDSALFADPSDPQSWAERLIAIQTDAALRTRLAEAGRRRASQWRWEDSARRMLDIYDDLTGA